MAAAVNEWTLTAVVGQAVFLHPLIYEPLTGPRPATTNMNEVQFFVTGFSSFAGVEENPTERLIGLLDDCLEGGSPGASCSCRQWRSDL
jgi:hypothetical protein